MASDFDRTFIPRLPDYENLEYIGEGSSGYIFKGVQKNTGQFVAVKILKQSATRQQIARFEREAKICAEINHPYIVKLLDKGYTPKNEPYVVFEYVSGATLKELILKKNGLEATEAKELMGQVLDALSCAHSNGIIHQDLKPENIMVSKTGTRPFIKVLDFGIGSFINESLTGNPGQGKDITGTPAYSSPEQLRGEVPTFKSDLYSWGLVVLETLTGQPGIQAGSLAEVYYQQLNTSEVPLPPFIAAHPLGTFLRRVLDKNPGTRAGNAHKLFEEYNKIDFNTLAPDKSNNRDFPDSYNHTQENTLSWNNTKGEKRQLTVLCAKLTLITTGECNMEDEILEQIQQDQLHICSDIALRFGGYLKGTLADQLMVYFGYPQSTGNDARLAGRTGLEIVNQVGKRSAQLHNQYGVRLAIKVAIHSGSIVSRPNVIPEGMTPNVAFHLLSHTPPGKILISQFSKELLNQYLETGKFKKIKFPNSESQFQAYNLIKERSSEAFAQLQSSSINRKMHGRDKEKSEIINSWKSKDTEYNKVFLIKGQAGIGKSKLINEVKNQVRSEEGAVIEVKCLPENKNNSFLPISNIIEKHFGLSPLLTDHAKISILEKTLKEAGCKLESSLPVLCSWLAISFGEKYTPPQLTPAEQKTVLFETVGQCLRHLSAREKHLLIIEDLHWADPTTKEFLGWFLSSSGNKNYLLLLTARNTFAQDWQKQGVKEIKLEPVNKTTTGSIIRELLDEKEIDPAALEFITDCTDGIPIYIEEFTSMLLAKGHLVLNKNSYQIARDTDISNIPVTLNELLNFRLDQTGLAKETAQLAATIGREFEYNLLTKVSLKDEALLQADLEKLSKADLIYRVRTVTGDRYIFRHQMFRNAAYNSQISLARQEVHERISEILVKAVSKKATPDSSESETLANHLYHAKKIREALDWLQKCLDVLVKKSATKEAISVCYKALSWVQDLPEIHERQQREFSIRTVLLTNLVISESYGSDSVGEQLYILTGLWNKMENEADLFPSIFLFSNYYAMRGDWQSAMSTSRKLYDEARKAQNTKWIIVSSAFLALHYFNNGEFVNAAEVLEHSLSLCNENEHSDTAYEFGIDQETFTCSILASIYAFLQKTEEIPPLVSRAKKRVEALKHSNTTASLYLGLSCIYFYLENKELVSRYSQVVIDLNKKTNLSMFENYATILNSWALNDLQRAKEALKAEEDVGLRSMRSFWHAVVARIEIESGFFKEAKERLFKCLSFIGTTDGAFYKAEINRLLGVAFLETNDTLTGMEYFKTAKKTANQQRALLVESKVTDNLNKYTLNTSNSKK